MTARGAFFLLLAGLVGMLGVAWLTLPEMVPLHYDISGAADRIVERERALVEMAVVGLGVAALLGATAAGTSRLPLSMINVPHKEYWSRPENEPRLRSRVARDVWVCADLTLGLLIAVVAVTIVEAHSPDPSLGVTGIAVVVLFLVLILGYVLRAYRRYRPEGDR